MKKFAMFALLAVAAISLGCGQEEAVKDGIDNAAETAKEKAAETSLGDKADGAIDAGADAAKKAVDGE